MLHHGAQPRHRGVGACVCGGDHGRHPGHVSGGGHASGGGGHRPCRAADGFYVRRPRCRQSPPLDGIRAHSGASVDDAGSAHE